MSFFVARQPIFDCANNVFAYELLYRDGFDNFYNSEMDGDKATFDVLTSSFMVIGITEITGGKKAFINFTTNLLLEQIPTIFDNQIVVVEILEEVEPTNEIIVACQKLKDKGYIIALDDFVFAKKFIPLLKLADIVKVDYLNTDQETRKKLVKVAKKFNLELLAEKVETREEFKEGVEMGYVYFQGYFFSKPVILQGDDLPVYAVNYMEALKEINNDNADITKISGAIGRDVSLSYKLLKLINSAAFGVRNEVESIRNAIVLLGLNEVKKWMNLIVVKEMANEQEAEILRLSLIRAKFCESISEKIGKRNEKAQFFLMGLFSLIDVLLKQDLEKLLEELPIGKEIKWSLLGYKGLMNNVYKLIIAYEKADWENFINYSEKINLKEAVVADMYLEAIEWCNQIMELEVVGV